MFSLKRYFLFPFARLLAVPAYSVFAMQLSAVPNEAHEPDPGLDPTVLHSRVKFSNEFIEQAFDSSKNTAKLNFSYAFGNPQRRDWTVQLDLPFVAYRGGDQGGSPDASGIGDIQMRIGHVVDGDGVFRWALGVETQLNTAAQPQLGDGIFRLAPTVVFAVQPSRIFKFQTATQFKQSLSNEADVGEEQEIETKPSIQISLPEQFYIYVENSLEWDLRDDGRFSSKLKFEAGRSFGSKSEWVLSARYEMPLTTSTDNHTFTLGCAYVFR